MGDFISSTQLAAYLQADLDSTSADLAIRVAEGLVRGYCRQTISEVSTTAVLPVQLGDAGYYVDLPERPVSTVTTVEVNGTAYAAGVDYQVDGSRIWLADVTSSADDFAPVDTAEVTYTHGWAAIPDDVIAVTLSVSGRVYDNPRGMRMESVEGYTYTRGGAGDDILGATLSREERAVLNRYRVTAAAVRVA
jgi:hypothetical protein